MGQLPHFLWPESTFQEGKDLSGPDIPADLVHHIQVIRLKKNDELILTNGKGTKAQYEVQNNKPLKLLFKSCNQTPPPLPLIHVFLAPPQGDALKEALIQLTETGAHRIQFLQTQHLQRDPNKLSIEKLQKVVDTSCEQCARAWRPLIEKNPVKIFSALQQRGIHVVADENLSSQKEIGFFFNIPSSIPSTLPVYLWVGPEGGWSREERQFFEEAKCTFLGLGELILRVPTACVASVQFLRLVFQHLSNASPPT